MADVDVEIYVTRAAGGDLDLRSAYTDGRYGYLVTNPDEIINPGARQWERFEEDSIFVNGSFEMHAKLGMQQASHTILVIGPDHGWIQTSIDALVDAFSARSYEVHVVLDGYDYGWTCRRADFGSKFNKRFIHAMSAEVTFSYLRMPIPVAGPI